MATSYWRRQFSLFPQRLLWQGYEWKCHIWQPQTWDVSTPPECQAPAPTLSITQTREGEMSLQQGEVTAGVKGWEDRRQGHGTPSPRAFSPAHPPPVKDRDVWLTSASYTWKLTVGQMHLCFSPSHLIPICYLCGRGRHRDTNGKQM